MAELPLARLQEILGPRDLLSQPADCVAYSNDATWHAHRPDAIALPRDAGQIESLVRLANQHKFPITPRGAGTGLSGGCVPIHGGLVVSTARLQRIIDVDRRDLIAVVEPGVVTANLQAKVAAEGLMYPPDPSSKNVSTLGGNIAENAGGPRGFKYGVTRDYVLGLEVVLPDGARLNTGGRTVKNVTGYDLTRLLVGSEGTLGIITSATLRLVPQPETQMTLLATFDQLEAAGDAVGRIVAAGIVPATIELMDRLTLEVVEQFLKAGWPKTEAALLIEVDGYDEAVRRQQKQVADLCHAAGARTVELAADLDAAAKLWQGRRSVNPALTRLGPVKVGEDVVVPPSRVTDFIRRFQYLRGKFNLPMVTFGHAGDGNLHPNVVMDPRDQAQVQEVNEWLAEVARLALDLGGSLSGEHGIGLLKAPFLEWEVGAVGLRVMRSIKAALDPAGIMNPGKMRLDPEVLV